MGKLNVFNYLPRSAKFVNSEGFVVNLIDVLSGILGALNPTSKLDTKSNFNFYLTDTGKLDGNYEATGDYSTTPIEFKIQPKEGTVVRINRMIVTIEDGGSIDSGGYGNQTTPLTNGIIVEERILGREVVIQSAQVPITKTADWGCLCYDGKVQDFGSGNSFYNARWSFNKYGSPIIITSDDVLAVRLNDDFTHLESHRFLIQGDVISLEGPLDPI